MLLFPTAAAAPDNLPTLSEVIVETIVEVIVEAIVVVHRSGYPSGHQNPPAKENGSRCRVVQPAVLVAAPAGWIGGSDGADVEGETEDGGGRCRDA